MRVLLLTFWLTTLQDQGTTTPTAIPSSLASQSSSAAYPTSYGYDNFGSSSSAGSGYDSQSYYGRVQSPSSYNSPSTVDPSTGKPSYASSRTSKTRRSSASHPTSYGYGYGYATSSYDGTQSYYNTQPYSGEVPSPSSYNSLSAVYPSTGEPTDYAGTRTSKSRRSSASRPTGYGYSSSSSSFASARSSYESQPYPGETSQPSSYDGQTTVDPSLSKPTTYAGPRTSKSRRSSASQPTGYNYGRSTSSYDGAPSGYNPQSSYGELSTPSSYQNPSSQNPPRTSETEPSSAVYPTNYEYTYSRASHSSPSSASYVWSYPGKVSLPPPYGSQATTGPSFSPNYPTTIASTATVTGYGQYSIASYSYYTRSRNIASPSESASSIISLNSAVTPLSEYSVSSASTRKSRLWSSRRTTYSASGNNPWGSGLYGSVATPTATDPPYIGTASTPSASGSAQYNTNPTAVSYGTGSSYGVETTTVNYSGSGVIGQQLYETSSSTSSRAPVEYSSEASVVATTPTMSSVPAYPSVASGSPSTENYHASSQYPESSYGGSRRSTLRSYASVSQPTDKYISNTLRPYSAAVRSSSGSLYTDPASSLSPGTATYSYNTGYETARPSMARSASGNSSSTPAQSGYYSQSTESNSPSPVYPGGSSSLTAAVLTVFPSGYYASEDYATPSAVPQDSASEYSYGEYEPSPSTSVPAVPYNNARTTLPPLPAPYAVSSMVPVFTPDTLGPAYGGGYWGLPDKYESSSAAPPDPSLSGIPIGYTNTVGPYTNVVATVTGASYSVSSSLMSEATESPSQNRYRYSSDKDYVSATNQGSQYTSLSAYAPQASPNAGYESSSYAEYSTSSEAPYTTSYPLGYEGTFYSVFPDPFISASELGYVSPSQSPSERPCTLESHQQASPVPSKGLPSYGAIGYRNSTKQAARTASPAVALYSGSGASRVSFASLIVVFGTLGLLLAL